MNRPVGPLPTIFLGGEPAHARLPLWFQANAWFDMTPEVRSSPSTRFQWLGIPENEPKSPFTAAAAPLFSPWALTRAQLPKLPAAICSRDGEDWGWIMSILTSLGVE